MQKQYLKRLIHSEGFLYSLKLWVLANILYSVIGLAAWWMFSPIRPADPEKLWGTTPIEIGVAGGLAGVWLRWDGIHYLKIAEMGYTHEMLTAYFPLYPWLSHLIGVIFGGSELVGMLVVSRLALLLGLILLFKICNRYYEDSITKNALLYTVFFPTAVFLLAPYPISQALMFSLAAIWFALTEKWFLSTLMGLLAGLTHGTTAPLAVGLLVIAFQQIIIKGKKWPILFAACSPILGTGIFLAWRIFSGFPDYQELLFQYWFRISQPPWMIIEDFKRFYWGYMGHADGWVNLTLLLIAFALTIGYIKKLPLALWLYQVTGLIFLSSTAVLNTPFGSVGRYLLLMFPLFIEMGTVTKGRLSRMIVFMISLFAALFLAMVYFMWGWLA